MTRDSSPAARARRPLFAGLTALLLLAGTEAMLRVPWVESRLAVPDPTFGIRAGAPLLRRSGDHWTLAPGADRSFNPVSARVDRDDVDLRIVCLGGSSTFGYPYGAEVSFCHFLGERLAGAVPGETVVEAINLGGMSYGSHRVAGLVDTVVALEPDAVVLYSGHNEFVETEMVDRVLGAKRGSRHRGFLSRSRLVAWLEFGIDRLLRPDPSHGRSSDDLFGFTVARSEGRIYTLEEKEQIARAFERRLDTIVERFRQHGTATILSTVPSSLSGWKPDRLAFAYPLPPRDRQQFLTSLAGGMRLLELGRFDEAGEALAGAEAIDDRHALTAYLRGIASWQVDDGPAALAHFTRARDLDPIPIRATSEINGAIRRVAMRNDVPLVDAEQHFAALSPDGVVGERLILDYCHPTGDGHREIARQVMTELMRLPAFSRVSPDRLAAPANSSEDALDSIEGSANVLWWLGVVAERQDRLESARSFFERALERDPRHAMGLRHLAQLDQREGRLEEARERLRLLTELPGAGPADRLALASHDVHAGRLDEGAALLEGLRREIPNDASLWLAIGQLERARGRWADARQALERAITLEPGLYPAYTELGAACRELRDQDCAVRAFEGALSLARYSPSALEALEELDSETSRSQP